MAGCDGDSDPAPSDVYVDADVASHDGGRDAATDSAPPDEGADLGSPDRTATVSGGGLDLTISFAPFSLSIGPVGDGGEVVAREGADPVASGLSFGIATHHRRGNYYAPTLEDLPTEVVWYELGEVESSEITASRAQFTVRSSSAGAPGPTVTLTAEATATGVSLRVQHEDDAALVLSSLTMKASDGESFFGLGEQFDRLDLRASMREMLLQTTPDSASSTNEVHVPIPFVISSRGYGIFVDDRAPSAFDLGVGHEDALRMTVASHDITTHFMASPEPMDLVERYTDITGKPAAVPFWALAPHFWRNETTRDELLDDARRARAMGFPSSVVWIDRPWSSYYHNWRFDPSTFPEPESMFAELGSLGYRVMLHHSPQINVPGTADIDEDTSEGLYALYRDNGWLVTLQGGVPLVMPWGGGDGAFVDYSNPGAVEHVQSLIERVTDLGAYGTKMDWDEYLQPNLGSIRIETVFANGETNMTMKGWYSALYHKAIIEAFDRQQGEATFHVSRTGTPRDQVWNTCIWPGDLDNDFAEHTRPEAPGGLVVGGLPSAIVANQTLGMGGYPCFASDIGGFRGGQPSEEVLIRWTEFGVFNAVMQSGGGGASHMPWTADSIYSNAASEIIGRYYRLRMALVPYIFSGLLASHRTGRPFVRSLWFAHPDDVQTRAHEHDFMFGDDLLVAPVAIEGATTRQVYLPEGPWIDIWTGERLVGPQLVERPAPLETIPVFIRGGAIVPLLPEGIDTLLEADVEGVTSLAQSNHFRLWIAPGQAAATRSFYNGVTVAVSESDGTLSVSVHLLPADASLDPRFAKTPETLELIVETAGTPLDGGPAEVILTRDGASTALSSGLDCLDCYRTDATRHQLMVTLDGEADITLTP